MLDGTLGNYTNSEYKIELEKGAKSNHVKPFPIPEIPKETLQQKVID